MQRIEMINVIGARKAYGDRELWCNLSLTVCAGDMLALTGPSGCGKSTLLNCLGLLDSLDEGSIEIDGANVARMSGRRKRLFRRDRLGYLFQNYALIDNATVKSNLDIASRATSGRTGDSYAEALEMVGL